MGLRNLNYWKSLIFRFQYIVSWWGWGNWMFCRQCGGYLMSHTGTCACLAVAQRWHLLWKVTAAKCNVHLSQNNLAHTRGTGSALPVDCGKMSQSHVLPLRILPHPAHHGKLAPPSREPGVRTGALDLSRWAADSLISLVPSLRCNYPDCRSTVGDAGTHKGLTMEKANRDAHLCSTMDSKPWSLVLFAMNSHTWEDKPNWSWDTPTPSCRVFVFCFCWRARKVCFFFSFF